MTMNVYKVELYDSKNNEFFFVEMTAKDSHEALCLAESEWGGGKTPTVLQQKSYKNVSTTNETSPRAFIGPLVCLK